MNERREARSPYRPYPRLLTRTRSEVLAELKKACGRFLPLLSTEEKLGAYIAGMAQAFDAVRGEAVFIGDGVPLNWQHLVKYLHASGIVTSPRFTFQTQSNDRPKLMNVRLDLRSQEPNVFEAGFGASFTREEALSKAIGETLERYFLTGFNRNEAYIASYADRQRSRGATFDITSLTAYLPWQKEQFSEFDLAPDSPLAWVKGEKFETGENVWLPAQLVFWKYNYGDEKKLACITTSGCAGHFSKDEAVLSALLESIQRDGFLIYWLNSLAPRLLDVSDCDDPDVRTLLSTLERYRLEATFLNTTSDIGIPSATCVIVDRTSKEPQVSIGASTGFDVKGILMQSAIEALLVSDFAARQPAFILPEDYKPFVDRTIQRTERLSLWRGERMLERFSFFLKGEKQDLATFIGNAEKIPGNERLAYTLTQLRKLGQGYETYVYEVDHPVLKTLGYHVVRAIVPQLVPLYLLEHGPTLDSRRLREVPKKLGFTPSTTLNPWPHPFP